MFEVKINDDESLEDLQCCGLHLIQKKDGFRFGVDAVLLANFADVKSNANIIDLCTGTGVVPVLLSTKTDAQKIIGVEIQSQLCEMFQRTIQFNNLSSKVQIIEGDIRNLDFLAKGSFDSVTCNPPYIKFNCGIRNRDITKHISRHEVLCTLEDVVKSSERLLRVGGQFVIVHKPERIVDIFCLMREYKVEPKYIRFVHPYPNKKPNIVLIKGIKQSGSDLKILDPLYVYESNGKFSEEINKIYGRSM